MDLLTSGGQTASVERDDDDEGCFDNIEGVTDRDVNLIGVEAAVPLNLQQAVDQEAVTWADIWQRGLAGQGPKLPNDLGASMLDIALCKFRSACMAFPCGEGLGLDKMHLRAIVRCSDLVIRAFIALLALAETSGHWHDAVGVILVFLLPRSDGGRRPIDVFPTLIRMWMHCRLDIAQEWVTAHDRSYFYAGPSKGGDVAAWKQCLHGEAAQSIQLPYLSTLLDLVKAFDAVPFDYLAQCAGRVGYNHILLRLSIAVYMLATIELRSCSLKSLTGS